jgi:hypothetical protein
VEILRTRENDMRLQSGVVGLMIAKENVALGACFAVIGNSNPTTKPWTVSGITTDGVLLLFSHQRKSRRRDVVRILQRDKETLQTVIRLVTAGSIDPEIRCP